jgi:murein DD-endopeptidase MepM/ murein hydrolase activator NlpD
MLRVILTIVILAAAALVALWQFDVIELPWADGALSSREAPPNVFDAAKAADREKLDLALAAGASLDLRDEFGQTPLMYAVSANAGPEFIGHLLKKGAAVNAQSDSQWTPLMYAARDSSSSETLLLLLNAAADPTIRNSEGQTALDLMRGNPALASPTLLRRLEQLTEAKFNPAWPSGYVVPVEGATISGRASHLPGALRAYRNGYHEGFDFYQGTVSVPIAFGTPIHAVAAGTVVRADHSYTEMTADEYNEVIATALGSMITPPELLDKLRGRQVWIEHPGGFVSRYAHLSTIEAGVQVGARVAQGAIIAATGNSGTIEAVEGTEDDPHPHVEIWRPETYLGSGMDQLEIYELAGQVFGLGALPPFIE